MAVVGSVAEIYSKKKTQNREALFINMPGKIIPRKEKNVNAVNCKLSGEKPRMITVPLSPVDSS